MSTTDPGAGRDHAPVTGDDAASARSGEGARRKRPVRRQERGRRRMESILDAAEEVIAEIGYPATTTNAVAARAGISPGSLYQFFRNKDEILEGLLQRYENEQKEFWRRNLTDEDALTPLDELIDRLVDAMVAFKSSRPAFWALFHGSATSDRLAEAARQLHEGVSHRLAEVFGLRSPGLSPERRLTLARMATAMVRAVMPMVVEAEPGDAPGLIAELKTMLYAYLHPALDLPGRSG
ncbi:TetR/AcrR family transcriptional regulator [Thermostaphylospora chromogena]|uniref:DNA-binding transcriptional regulator, AcrR family n=1 Tax=Thermostaphylospora chromogena TaxID=35622 RepID=A0A1H1G6S0_9ACTN|nr:TetR/AcrR family transcriptional regulator [Thermostaphylospora chromogena]SDR08891.1 DNA-binding transcriptional regulator, AcrR family [Thermostaphylospora chromogena]